MTTKRQQDTPEYTAEYLQRILDRINEVHNDPHATDETLSKMRAEAGKIDAFFANARDALVYDDTDATDAPLPLPRDMTKEEMLKAEKEGRILTKIEETDYGICYYYYYLINGKEEKVNFNVINGIHTGATKQHTREVIFRNIYNERHMFLLNDVEAERRARLAETNLMEIEYKITNFVRARTLQDALPPEQFANILEILNKDKNDKSPKECAIIEIRMKMAGLKNAMDIILDVLDNNAHMRLEYFAPVFDVMDEYDLRRKYRDMWGEGYKMEDADKITDEIPERMHNALQTLMHYLQTTEDKETLAKIIKQWEDRLTAINNMQPDKKEYNRIRRYYLKSTTEYDKKKTRAKK